MKESISPLQRIRQSYQPKCPRILQNIREVAVKAGAETSAVADAAELKQLFPHSFGQPTLHLTQGEQETRALKVGVVLSGGQAPGGHNVICGIYDALQELHPESCLIGFLDGPSGITDNQYRQLSRTEIDNYRNTGGFDMIGSGRTKIETAEQFAQALKTVREHQLDGLVVIGGDDSNTNAALLAEYFLANEQATRVIGVPKTIDGDLKNQQIEISFGHDTACKTYSEIIGNLARDAMSAKKYSFFVKLMGRSASHVTLECALQTHPNWVFIAEEVAAKKWTLKELTNQLCSVICRRAERGKNYGVYLIPEGLLEFIPECRQLISELNTLLATKEADEAVSQLSPDARSCFDSLPSEIQNQLLMDRDPHGNVQVSKIETERLFIQTVKKELEKRKASGEFKGAFSAQPFFCGYEGRSCPPSNFDSQYCYALGKNATALIQNGSTGYMSCLRRLTTPLEEWEAGGIPITMMMNLEERHGKQKPVIQKALVELDAEPFNCLQKFKEEWATGDHYRFPGPVQYFGDAELTESCTQTLALECTPALQT